MSKFFWLKFECWERERQQFVLGTGIELMHIFLSIHTFSEDNIAIEVFPLEDAQGRLVLLFGSVPRKILLCWWWFSGWHGGSRHNVDDEMRRKRRFILWIFHLMPEWINWIESQTFSRYESHYISPIAVASLSLLLCLLDTDLSGPTLVINNLVYVLC